MLMKNKCFELFKKREFYQGCSFAVFSFWDLFIYLADTFVYTDYVQGTVGDMPSRSLWWCKGLKFKEYRQIILVLKKCDKTLREVYRKCFVRIFLV